MANKEVGNSILNALILAGANKAECIISKNRVDELNIDNGNINLLRSLFTTNITMRVIKDNKSGTITVNNTEKETLEEAVVACINAAEVSMVEEAEDIAELTKNIVVGEEREVDLEKLHFRLEELVDDTAKRYPKILLNEIHASFESGNRLHKNTNGVEMEEHYHRYDIMLEFSARDKDISSSVSGINITTCDLDTPFIEIGKLSQILQQTQDSIYPTALESKFEGTILMMPEMVNQLLLSVQGLLLSDGSLIDGTSQWKNSIEKEVASPEFTLSCSYSDKDIVTSGRKITNDGYLAADVKVIDQGVLKSFLLSRFGSRKTGINRSKNYGTAFVVEPGRQPLEDIIASIDRGILIGQLSGNQPGASGEVSGVAKGSFLIEEGKIKGAINETMISCNVLELLKNIRAISKEQVCTGYYKLPYIAFDKVVISGK